MPVNPQEAGSFVSLRLSTAREFERFKPAVEVFCDSRVPWLSPLDGAAQFAGMPEAV